MATLSVNLHLNVYMWILIQVSMVLLISCGNSKFTLSSMVASLFALGFICALLLIFKLFCACESDVEFGHECKVMDLNKQMLATYIEVSQ